MNGFHLCPSAFSSVAIILRFGDNFNVRFHSAASTLPDSRDALNELTAGARSAMDGKIDVAFVFFTAEHLEDAERMLENLWLSLDPQCVIGCSAEGVIGGKLEIERSAGMALLVGQLPGVGLHPFHIENQAAWRQVLNEPAALRQRSGCGETTAAIIALADPFTTPMAQWLSAMDGACPRLPIVGGMASSAQRPGENALLKNDRVYRQGLVGLALSGPIAVETVVSQGCRPIGRPMVITKSHDNVIEQIGGRPPLEVLRDTVEELSDAERELLQNGLMVGQAISEFKERFGRGDFLVKNLVGVDEESGSVAVADIVRTGQTVQYHVRDAATADEDLAMLLESQALAEPAVGGLLCSCNGRGTRMFAESGHDIASAHRAMPKTPLAGFFAAGELGPVGGKNFVHGHTASLALFRPTHST
jgi:small ligand-binding sensory domain FIST